MEKIKTTDRRQVLLKVGILAAVPIPVLLLFIISGVVGRSYCLFAPGANGYLARYLMETVHPDAHETKLAMSVAPGGNAVLTDGSTVYWQSEMYPDGMYRAETEESHPYYTLFWLPSYFRAIPTLKAGWIRELSQNAMMDLTGFFGEPGRTYAFKIRDDKTWFARPGEADRGGAKSGFATIRGVTPLLQSWENVYRPRRAPQEIFFIDAGGAIAGRAAYDTSNGLLIYAVSFAERGKSISLLSSNLPRRTFGAMLLPFVLITATALAFYEIFWTSVRPRKDNKGLPPSVEFAILGYTAVLVDVYLDFVYFPYAGDVVFVLAHVSIAALFWYRLGWWSALPIMEVGVAVFALALYGSLHEAFAFFPASIGTWLIALMIQGRVSPGQVPDFPFPHLPSSV